jgi:uncharacterized protein with ATP-grasp and redox domains
MKTYLDCIPCFFRQALEAARIAGADAKKQKKIIDEVAKLVRRFPLRATPPELGQAIHALVRKITGQNDPYLDVKRQSHDYAYSLLKELRRKIERAADPLLTAVELAVAGNIIDFGVKNTLDVKKEIKRILAEEKQELKKEDPLFFQYAKFKKELARAEKILYLGDNVGETVFDRLLLEQITKTYPGKNIFYAVRGAPVINDALEADACAAGIDRFARIIANGYDAPGTILARCDRKFQELFNTAELIISKGQGNFETLSERKEPLFFLFLAKCPVVAQHLSCLVGTVVLRQGEKRRR